MSHRRTSARRPTRRSLRRSGYPAPANAWPPSGSQQPPGAYAAPGPAGSGPPTGGYAPSGHPAPGTTRPVTRAGISAAGLSRAWLWRPGCPGSRRLSRDRATAGRATPAWLRRSPTDRAGSDPGAAAARHQPAPTGRWHPVRVRLRPCAPGHVRSRDRLVDRRHRVDRGRARDGLSRAGRRLARAGEPWSRARSRSCRSCSARLPLPSAVGHPDDPPSRRGDVGIGHGERWNDLWVGRRWTVRDRLLRCSGSDDCRLRARQLRRGN